MTTTLSKRHIASNKCFIIGKQLLEIVTMPNHYFYLNSIDSHPLHGYMQTSLFVQSVFIQAG